MPSSSKSNARSGTTKAWQASGPKTTTTKKTKAAGRASSSKNNNNNNNNNNKRKVSSRKPQHPNSAKTGGQKDSFKSSRFLLLKLSDDISIDAVLRDEESNEDKLQAQVMPTKRAPMILALMLNLLTLSTGYLAFRALFCNSIDCVYVGPNTVCEAVIINDTACVTDPYSCNCGAGSDVKANNFCNIENNNCACNWDGGDCCFPDYTADDCDGIGPTADQCACADPDYDYPCNGLCRIPDDKGDGICDDGNNNCACDWDGGDCCFASHDCDYCGTYTCDFRVKFFFDDCETMLTDEGCSCEGCGSCSDNPDKYTRCLDCQCLDPTYSVRSNYSYKSEFRDQYRVNETFTSFSLEEVCSDPYSGFVIADYDWDPACECPCNFALWWYVNFAWVFIFGATYFIYLLEACLLHTTMKAKNELFRKCVNRLVTKHVLYTVRLNLKSSAVRFMTRLNNSVPTVTFILETFKSEKHYKRGAKPLKVAARRFRYVKWRDITPILAGVKKRKSVRLEFTKRLSFDGYSSLRTFQNHRQAFLQKHKDNSENFYQVYSEQLDIPDFTDRTFRVTGLGFLFSMPFYLVFTIGGLSWFYRFLLEFISAEYVVTIDKLVSMTEFDAEAEGWKQYESSAQPGTESNKKPQKAKTRKVVPTNVKT